MPPTRRLLGALPVAAHRLLAVGMLGLPACRDQSPTAPSPSATTAVSGPVDLAAQQAQISGLINSLFAPKDQGAIQKDFARVKNAVARKSGDAEASVVAFVENPDGELMGAEAFIWTLLGAKDEALDLLKRYFTLNPGHRALFARSNSWWWRSLRDDPRFADLVGHQAQ